MSKITKEEVEKLANLSKLSLTPEEVKLYQDQLTEILGYVERLSKVDTRAVEVKGQVTGLEMVAREDVTKEYSCSSDNILSSLPNREKRYIKTKKVL
ncbi:Asp-tRNA(Asn)/Glu-tRNA(Gln) amidotransferase subunit GatC [Candidatus Saccharibacteria bacterium CPR2]|nr:Asp-tRNA(Asn)/Glu-tRNA(Gln) amidotransferase subunit GatC [Candidatus Saccharibacteria bacterium CPR2]